MRRKDYKLLVMVFKAQLAFQESDAGTALPQSRVDADRWLRDAGVIP